MPINIHNTKFFMPDGASVGMEDLENTINIEEINNVQIVNKEDGDVLVWFESLSKWLNVPFTEPYLTLERCFEKGIEGFLPIMWGSQIRKMLVSHWNGRAYVEIFFCSDPSPTTPWDRPFVSADNYFTSYNLNSVSLNYPDAVLQLNGPSPIWVTSLSVAMPITNVIFTGKLAGASGINPSRMIETSHLTPLQIKKYGDYFTGQISGFEQLDSFGWDGGAGMYDTHLGFRNGAVDSDEWLIQDSATGNQLGAPRWGFRGSGSNKGAKAANLNVGVNNILSIFVTTMTY